MTLYSIISEKSLDDYFVIWYNIGTKKGKASPHPTESSFKKAPLRVFYFWLRFAIFCVGFAAPYESGKFAECSV